jgi:hypothetical protein
VKALPSRQAHLSALDLPLRFACNISILLISRLVAMAKARGRWIRYQDFVPRSGVRYGRSKRNCNGNTFQKAVQSSQSRRLDEAASDITPHS